MKKAKAKSNESSNAGVLLLVFVFLLCGLWFMLRLTGGNFLG